MTMAFQSNTVVNNRYNDLSIEMNRLQKLQEVRIMYIHLCLYIHVYKYGHMCAYSYG
jgi:hypothetical protein